ncbi:uncharacterized protein PGRI_083680 [Penicillium griseofulvum]|uniref:Uncharacterized protein n=1 Tax=Penicillium patulum TaxID=5078 RepID=A0A135LSY1_PENPA|nr:uncharacterized protein PGRI_083680 [Penicillium griseofulvum]KXG52084.1 hypothetical protein PGRI_083680 [Penicillium griseofulvum]
MSTTDEKLSDQNPSIWHIYHKGDRHISITPFINPKKEFGFNKKKHEKPAGDQDEESNYFIHHPTLIFHNPPRTLRRGNKNGTPICLIKCGTFWRNWTIQLGDLKDVIDPRGVVKWECRSNTNNTLNDDRALKGYKVRSWRVWGESGKEYHRLVNLRRKEMEFAERENMQVVHDTPKIKITEDGKQGLDSRTEYPSSPYSATPHPALAEEAVRLSWRSPVSLSPRRYTFEYANIKFSWEGTRDVHSTRRAKWIMPFSHLMLIARLPENESEDILVGQYTASFASCKYGELWVFDSAVAQLLDGHSSDVRETRLYELIITTAMCMIIGERGKRNTLLALLALLAEGGGAS